MPGQAYKFLSLQLPVRCRDGVTSDPDLGNFSWKWRLGVLPPAFTVANASFLAEDASWPDVKEYETAISPL